MSRPLLIVVSGSPASGKTSIARHLASELCVPLLNKDGFKEVLYDTLGWSDQVWSHRLGRASFALLFHAADRLLAAQTSLVLEANFDATLSCDDFRTLQRTHDASAVQILCVGRAEVFIERFRERNASGDRHPGHVDDPAEIEANIRNATHDALCVDGPRFELDTTDFDNVDLPALTARIRPLLGDRRDDGADPERRPATRADARSPRHR